MFCAPEFDRILLNCSPELDESLVGQSGTGSLGLGTGQIAMRETGQKDRNQNRIPHTDA